jgi:predicted DNA-binding transcriptional regulator AlpA
MQDRILNKARELMFQTGVKHVTMDDLATQLGISKKTIYQYFKDKDALPKVKYGWEYVSKSEWKNQFRNPKVETNDDTTSKKQRKKTA